MQPTSFHCPICGLTFDEQTWAEQCETWCRAHASCNLAITTHSRERQATMRRASTRDALAENHRDSR